MIFFSAKAVYTVEMGIALREGVTYKGISVVGIHEVVRFRSLGSL